MNSKEQEALKKSGKTAQKLKDERKKLEGMQSILEAAKAALVPFHESNNYEFLAGAESAVGLLSQAVAAQLEIVGDAYQVNVAAHDTWLHIHLKSSKRKAA